jgi:DNA processing protein
VTAAADLPESVFAAALAGLPGIGPATLGRLLTGCRPSQAWGAVLDGTVGRPPPRGHGGDAGGQPKLDGPPPGSRPRPERAPPPWSVVAGRVDLAALGLRLATSSTEVTWVGDARYPAALASDPEPPGVLFWRGRLEAATAPTVAVVGTRRCSPDGSGIAYQLGYDLAAAGVCVVSGLALGIDGAAHRGALAAPAAGESPVTIGVAASGADVPYPRQHAQLWSQVAAAGAVVSETPPGQPAQAWRFPARNRIIAALADLVVVVESFVAGGSMLTVEAALARGVDVRAVPGPVHSPASDGTNRLLVDGAAPVRHAGDVLDALGLTLAAGTPVSPSQGVRGPDRPPLAPPEHKVLEAVGWAATSMSRIVERSGMTVGAVGLALAQLESRRLVEGTGDWWVRRERR